jgi:Mor family transcriptional regulator
LALSVLKYAGVFADVVRPLSRRAQIRQRYEKGDRLSELAREYGISPQRVWQIVSGT